ncbi:hypothetical protein KEJ17_08645, partial [Candidatus Bathyarchaeota archaeon]|nr:hypothetical protein [Candidatus Bathyarchaeota archaeon]
MMLSLGEVIVKIGDGGVPLGEVFVERPAKGKPHIGKVLVVVQAHADDISFFCAGTVAKLID